MITLDVRPETADRLAELAEESGLDVDAFLNKILDAEAEDAADAEEARRELANPERFTHEEVWRGL